MDALPQFFIPFSGLGDGVHEFDFQVDTTFFAAFEASPIKTGEIKNHLIFDKRSDMMVLTFENKGTVLTTCDRCLEEFSLPIDDAQSLIFKFSDEVSNDPDVVNLEKGTKTLNVAEYIYEFIILAIPMIKTHDSADEDCDEEMLNYLDPIEDEETKDEPESQIWGALKKFNNN
ncbi:MAG: hypothetical protein ACI9JY_001924 [Saprospiraceae bacterium]|jgi:uncharacterized protein